MIRPEFRSWKIAREASDPEDFDRLTLAASLIESEIDLPAAVAIFDEVIERMEKTAENSLITHNEIHQTVVACLLDYPSNKAPLWLANYDNLFGPVSNQEAVDENTINVRNISILKQHLFDDLAKFLRKGSADELTSAISKNQLSAIIDRLVRIVRYCGFGYVDRAFLTSFITELACRSTKTFISSATITDAELQVSYERAESFMLASRNARGESPAKRMNLLTLGL